MLMWRKPASFKAYNSHIKKWFIFSKEKDIPNTAASTGNILDFLQTYVDKGLSHSSVANARAALGSFVHITDGPEISKNVDIAQFIRGAFHFKPPRAKHTAVWDTSLVLQKLKECEDIYDLPLLVLSQRLCVLILLVSGQRVQYLHGLTLDDLKQQNGCYTLSINPAVLKQARPGFQLKSLSFGKFSCEGICVASHLDIYTHRTRKIRKDVKQLLITTTEPFGPASKDTVSRWTKDCLHKCGVDMSTFGPNSCRSASTSKAYAANVPIDTIMQAAGWARPSTFSKFYKKEIKVVNVFGNAVLADHN